MENEMQQVPSQSETRNVADHGWRLNPEATRAPHNNVILLKAKFNHWPALWSQLISKSKSNSSEFYHYI